MLVFKQCSNRTIKTQRYDSDMPFSGGVASDDMYYFPWRIERSVGGEGDVVVRGMGSNVALHFHPHLI